MNHTNNCLDENPNEANDPNGKVVPLPEKVTSTNQLSNHCTDPSAPHRTVVMDEVNFKYLKHVILKFLTSREVTDFVLPLRLNPSKINNLPHSG